MDGTLLYLFLMGTAGAVFFIFLIVLALRYFLGYTPKPAKDTDTATSIPLDCRYATVTQKEEDAVSGRYASTPKYLVEFSYDNGERILLDVPLSVYHTVDVGVRELLTVRENRFRSFGGEYEGLTEEIPAFEMDDFDEEIDVPLMDVYIPDELFGPGESMANSPEEDGLETLFRDDNYLPPSTFRGQATTDFLPRFSPLHLVRLCGLYPFLRLEQDIQCLYGDAYKRACQSLLTASPGMGSEAVRLHCNEFELTVTIQPLGDSYHIDAVLQINRDIEGLV